MFGQRPLAAASYVCGHCGEPLKLNPRGIQGRRVGDKFVCNEFCAGGIAATTQEASSRASPVGPGLGK